MTKVTDKRLEWHLSLPACETLTGVICHINHLTLSELFMPMQQFEVDSVHELSRAMWTAIKTRKNGVKC